MSEKKYSKTLFAPNWSKIHRDGEMLFDDLFSPKHPFSGKTWSPHTDVYETKEYIVIKMEIPGVQLEDVSVNIVGKKLTVSGTRHDLDIGEIISYHQMEINYSDFERNILLPKTLHKSDINAIYKDGFLIIKIDKNSLQKEVYREVEVK
jgi:HSP20 family protein